MEREAKAAGAKTLKITGWTVKNPGFGEKIRPLVIKKGGSFNLLSGSTEAGNAVIEITLPIK